MNGLVGELMSEVIMKSTKVKNLLKILPRIMKIYALYALIFGVVIFGLCRHNSSKYFEINSVERFLGNEICQDKVALVEGRFESGIVRINLIENAQETLDISYYTIQEGVSTNIFLACILEAADRGVQVRFILDGLFHNLRGELKDVIYAFAEHPNIELKFYEPFSLLKPWTWNNRLHDKIIVVDEHLVIIGGRNIGDKYFAQGEYDDNYDGITVDDRDVVIVNTDRQNSSGSVVSQVKNYFNYVWNHEYSKYPLTKLTQHKQDKGHKKAKSLSNYLAALKNTNPDLFNNHIDWLEVSIPTSKVTLIHNPIQRLNKEPWCWYEITNLMKSANDSIIIQSPYVSPTKDMLKYLNGKNNSPEEISILTNSIACSPNPLAISGYSLYREKIVDYGAKLYEFQGPNSIHAKSFIFDNRISLVGSFNFDSRSTFLSTETMVVIDSAEFAKLLKHEIKNQISNCLLVGKDCSYINNSEVTENVSPFKSIIIKILSAITYCFNYML